MPLFVRYSESLMNLCGGSLSCIQDQRSQAALKQIDAQPCDRLTWLHIMARTLEIVCGDGSSLPFRPRIVCTSFARNPVAFPWVVTRSSSGSFFFNLVEHANLAICRPFKLFKCLAITLVSDSTQVRRDGVAYRSIYAWQPSLNHSKWIMCPWLQGCNSFPDLLLGIKEGLPPWCIIGVTERSFEKRYNFMEHVLLRSWRLGIGYV